MKAYAKAVGALVEGRERSHKDVAPLITHFLPEEMLVMFVVKTAGTTVQELLNNLARLPKI